jgi:DNA-directed RNA polymerase subunit L
MPNAVCSYAEESDNSYKLNIESRKQLTEKEIIIRACLIIIIKLNNFLNIFTTKIKEYSSEKIVDDFNLDNQSDIKKSESESITESAIRNTSDEVLEQHRIKGMITIENESHTFGNLLSRLLQDHTSILFAGYKIEHLLIKELTIGYKTDGTDIVIILEDIITKAKDIFEQIKNNVETLPI